MDDPFLFGQIAAANALSDVYAMGGEPKLALNIMCLAPGMAKETVQDILRGGYDKAYEAGAIITGGHTIQGAEPIYGLAVSGFVHPKKVLTNSGAQPGDVLPADQAARRRYHHDRREGRSCRKGADRTYLPPDGGAQQGRARRDGKVSVHSCTDVTGFALLGHSFEMAQGSGVTVHIQTETCRSTRKRGRSPTWGLSVRARTATGITPNRRQADARDRAADAGYSDDPQTSGGPLIALPEKDAAQCL